MNDVKFYLLYINPSINCLKIIYYHLYSQCAIYKDNYPNNYFYPLPVITYFLSLRRKFVLRPLDIVFITPFCFYYPRQAVHSLTLEDYYLLKFKHRYMKQETMGLVIPINKEQMKELTKETKETLAIHAIDAAESNRTFGSVDLWNSRKNQRTMASMRRWIN